MSEKNKLLNLKEVSKILDINLEVLRRWLRNKKLPGIKVGSDWRVKEKDLEEFLNSSSNVKVKEKPGEPEPPQKMCFRFPKWLEFSGLPKHLNETICNEAWPVFKKIVELDFEVGKPEDRRIKLDYSEVAERIGYKAELVKKIVRVLADEKYVYLSEKGDDVWVEVVTPIRTPKLVLDISYKKGGIKGAPNTALENNCLRRFLEAKDMNK